MAMRETVTSLRVYFIVVGVFIVLSTIGPEAITLGSIANFREDVVAAGSAIIALGFGLAFIYFGLFLRRLLVHSVGTINVVLYASLAYLVLSYLYDLRIGFHPASLVFLAVGLGIIWYLLRTVKRLSQEERSSAQVMDAGGA